MKFALILLFSPRLKACAALFLSISLSGLSANAKDMGGQQQQFFKTLHSGWSYYNPKQAGSPFYRGPLAQTVYKRGKEYLQKTTQPIDWRSLPSAQVTFFGENHTKSAIRGELVKHMSDLRSAGVTHLATEMLRQEVQPLLDQYMAQGGARLEEKLLGVLRANISSSFHPESYFEMLRAAKKNGMKLIAANAPPYGHPLREGKNKIPQDQYCAQMLDDICRTEPNAKIVALWGALHVQRNGRSMQPQILQSMGRTCKTYCFLTGDRVIDNLLDAAHLNEASRYIPTRHTAAPFDGYLSIPEAGSLSVTMTAAFETTNNRLLCPFLKQGR